MHKHTRNDERYSKLSSSTREQQQGARDNEAAATTRRRRRNEEAKLYRGMEVALSSRHSLRRLVAHAHTRALSHSGSLARTASIDSGLSLCVFSPCLYLHLLGVCAVGGYFLEFLRVFCALISIEYRFGVCGVRFATVVVRVSERVI